MLWMSEDYILFACLILFITFSSSIYSLIELRKNLQQIKKMALIETKFLIFRGGILVSVHPSEFVPGDIIKIED